MRVDIAIIGAGFGGSLTALIAKQIGLQPVLIERGEHPRFAIGESSTPQADIVLASLADQYNLPRIKPLAQYGSWKETYPEINCGPKRGFSYFHHPRNGAFVPRHDRSNELLVAASPDQYHADTHWYRADFDAFLVEEVKNAGIPYFDNTELKTIEYGTTWKLEAENLTVDADFVLDAAGQSTVLANVLNIQQDISGVLTNSRVIYSHFRGVPHWTEIYEQLGGDTSAHPYPCHESALHHVFDGGWMYVLPFDNGITSAGFVLDNLRSPLDESITPEQEWDSLLELFPSIKQQFQHAVPTMPLIRTDRMQRCVTQMVGDNWAMLPYAACFLDPLHSAGIAHTLFGIERLIPILQSPHEERPEMLYEYQETTFREVGVLDKIIHGCYAGFDRFELLANFAMFYFVGADFTERKRRSGDWKIGGGFLNCDDPEFRSTVDRFHQQIISDQLDPAIFGNDIRVAIKPWNKVGLCDPSKQNLYDYA